MTPPRLSREQFTALLSYIDAVTDLSHGPVGPSGIRYYAGRDNARKHLEALLVEPSKPHPLTDEQLWRQRLAEARGSLTHRCECNCGSRCAMDRTGSENRCTLGELIAYGGQKGWSQA